MLFSQELWGQLFIDGCWVFGQGSLLVPRHMYLFSFIIPISLNNFRFLWLFVSWILQVKYQTIHRLVKWQNDNGCHKNWKFGNAVPNEFICAIVKKPHPVAWKIIITLKMLWIRLVCFFVLFYSYLTWHFLEYLDADCMGKDGFRLFSQCVHISPITFRHYPQATDYCENVKGLQLLTSISYEEWCRLIELL